ncbi:MAG: PHP domain-containing protein [Desulfobacteraceae bacterium]|nr:PHP domain-containing protein [Desulfobacteraceae bacterium]
MNPALTTQELKHFRADTHIHTCLSPCGDLEMGPRDIAAQSRHAGLDMIAVCDHNSAENAGAVMRAGDRVGLAVLPGMEICSREEVHVVALFETLEAAHQMQEFVYARLPGENQREVWGEQIMANEKNEVLGENHRLLIGATTLNLYKIVEQVHACGGLCIASHVDRPAYSLIGNLGFIPPDLDIDGIEVSFRVPLCRARQSVNGIAGYPCVTASDAHFLRDIGRAWYGLQMASPCFAELRMALKGENGRKIIAN